jgi:hypothetical protein
MPMGVDLGDSTYIIHKRIFKRSNSRRTGGRDSLDATPAETALINRFQVGFSVPDLIEPERGRIYK